LRLALERTEEDIEASYQEYCKLVKEANRLKKAKIDRMAELARKNEQIRMLKAAIRIAQEETAEWNERRTQLAEAAEEAVALVEQMKEELRQYL
jgi:hypothetical protein